MIKSFSEVIERLKTRGPARVAVAAAEDADVLTAVREAAGLGLVEPVLVGNGRRLETLARQSGLGGCEIIDAGDDRTAAATATALVAEGRALALMKGLINTSDFLRAVLDKERGLRTGRRLSHLAALERPGEGRLLFLSDGAITPLPDLEAKKEILLNALSTLIALGYEKPKVALLAANEQVNPRIPATADAAALVAHNREGGLPFPCLLEGPLALDVAVSRRAADHKGIESRLAGEVDLFLSPNLEAGNIFIKSLLYWAGASMAGLVTGARAPIILTSRSDSPEGKLNSIALAVLAASDARPPV